MKLDERNKEFVFIDGMPDANMKVAAEQIAAGGTAAVFDTGSSAEQVLQAQRAMLVGRKRNDGPAGEPKVEQPYYRRFDKRR